MELRRAIQKGWIIGVCLKRPGFTSEICGYSGGTYYPPKSFEGLDQIAQARAYDALFFLLGDYEDKKDFVYQLSDQNELSKLQSPLLFQLVLALTQIRDELRRRNYSLFVKSERFDAPVRGKPNFVKSLTKGYGLLHKTFKTVNEINNKTVERAFIELAVRLIGQKIKPRLGGAVGWDKVEQVLSEVARHLSDIPPGGQDLSSLTQQVLQMPYIPHRSDPLLPLCKIVASFLVETDVIQRIDGNDNVADRPVFDFLLNLNRPFEALLKRIVSKLGFGHRGLVEKGFANLYVKDSDGKSSTAKRMIPDAWGVHGENAVNTLIIMDAKHKIFCGEQLDDSIDEKSMGYMKREDLFQLISYIRTNHIDQETGLFGLAGLVNEDALTDEFEMIAELAPLNFDLQDKNENADRGDGDKSVVINRIAFRFGSILSRLGDLLKSGSDQGELENFYSLLALQFINCLDLDTVKSYCPNLINITRPNLLLSTDFGFRLDWVFLASGKSRNLTGKYFIEFMLGQNSANTPGAFGVDVTFFEVLSGRKKFALFVVDGDPRTMFDERGIRKYLSESSTRGVDFALITNCKELTVFNENGADQSFGDVDFSKIRLQIDSKELSQLHSILKFFGREDLKTSVVA